MVGFCLTVQILTDCFVLEVSTVSVSRFQKGICVKQFQKKSKQEKGHEW